MITVEEAFGIVLDNCKIAETELVSIHVAQGRILAETIIADRDFPPFDRVTMDGIAIQYNSFEKGQKTFPILGIAPAGSEQINLTSEDGCVEVMTGAMLPLNTDTVIRYEDVEIKDGQAKINLTALNFRQNIHFQGLDRQMGSVIIKPGKSIKAPELGVLATAGKAEVLVYKNPKVAIISSGDELVDVDKVPLAYQIRKSNNFSIKGALEQFRCPIVSFHITDDKEVVKNEIEKILKDFDIIILSGGVSKGKFDYIPEALEQLKVRKLFHKVKQRPGKPFWFGVSEEEKVVFALPGNPVSSFMCTNKYVLPWFRKHLNANYKQAYAELNSDITFKPDLNYFAQVELTFNAKGKILAHPVEGNGSGDLANLTDADAFIELARGKDLYKKGEAHPILMIR